MHSILASVAVSAALVLGGMWLHIDTFNDLSNAVDNLSAAEQQFGLAVFDEVQGGTGTSTVSANYVGDCLSVTDDSPLTYSWATCAGGAGSGDPYPFQGANNSTSTLVRLYGGASTTLLSSHRAWFGSTATSSFGTDGALTLASALAVTSGGTGVTALNDLIGTANQLTVTSGADTIIGGDATFSLPNHVIFPANFQATDATTTNATTTSLNVTGAYLDFDNFTSALLLTGASGIVAEYAGTSCTNQFVRSLDAVGAATCATIGSADVSLANLTATDSSLTFSGTYNGSTARTIGVNLGHAFVWTSTHDFGGATSVEMVNGTAPTVDAIGEFALDTTNNLLLIATSTNASFPAVIPTRQYAGFSYATTTWTGTTTINLGPAYLGETWTAIKCYTDAGTLNARVGDGTNWTSMFAVTSTVGEDALLTNNTFTTDEKRQIEVGTPATAPRVFSCTVNKYTTRD